MLNSDIYIKNLQIKFPQNNNYVNIIDDISIHFASDLFIGIIGESGCGKSILGEAIIGNLPDYVKVEGSICYKNINLLTERTKIKNFYTDEFGVIPQNPSESLNPLRNIRKQMDDVLLVGTTNEKLNTDNTYKQKLLTFFGLKNTTEILKKYIFELSGGMQQRVVCAMGILNQPRWILADEPTKGLDERTCQVVYTNLAKIKNDKKHSMLIITHDLKLVKNICDKVAVMYAGQIVEYGDDILKHPLHPYTKSLLASLPENGFQINTIKNDENLDFFGCKFARYCKYCSKQCREKIPDMYDVKNTKVRCFLYA